jgi:diaminopimelate decarboxylase
MPVMRQEGGARILELGGVSLADVAADPRIGTPAYVYDLDAISAEARELDQAFEGAPHLVAYAVKANSAGPVVRAVAAQGCGADVVSGAELVLAQRCGIAPDRILYSGVGKTDEELDLAVSAGDAGIAAIQIESVEEIARIAARAANAGRVARVSLRINPGVDAEAIETHRHIATGHDDAKFGVPLSTLADALERLARSPALRLVGLTSHVGSQFTDTSAYLASARALFGVAKELRPRLSIAYLDTGGGFGIDYGQGCAARPADFVRATRALQREHGLDDLALTCEPGRSIVGAHGVLVAKVIQRKVAGERRWTMIDAGMNDLMRPALYQAFHRVAPIALPPDGEGAAAAPLRPWRVVGPVCESSDDFGIHDLPEGDLSPGVALLDAGAYGYSMASRYNGRPLPAEVFVSGGRVVSFRARRPLGEWVDDRLGAG